MSSGYLQPPLSVARVLGNMLENVEWRKPLDGMQAESIRECAAWILAGLTDNPFDPNVGTTPQEIAMAHICECVLAWVGQPQDHDRIDRLQSALMTYWRISDE